MLGKSISRNSILLALFAVACANSLWARSSLVRETRYELLLAKDELAKLSEATEIVEERLAEEIRKTACTTRALLERVNYLAQSTADYLSVTQNSCPGCEQPGDEPGRPSKDCGCAISIQAVEDLKLHPGTRPHAHPVSSAGPVCDHRRASDPPRNATRGPPQEVHVEGDEGVWGTRPSGEADGGPAHVEE